MRVRLPGSQTRHAPVVVRQTKLKELEASAAKAEQSTDPFEKQLMLNECRARRRELAAAAKGCGDVGEKLNVVLDFLAGFQDELAIISSNLDAVQGAGTRRHAVPSWHFAGASLTWLKACAAPLQPAQLERCVSRWRQNSAGQ